MCRMRTLVLRVENTVLWEFYDSIVAEVLKCVQPVMWSLIFIAVTEQALKLENSISSECLKCFY